MTVARALAERRGAGSSCKEEAAFSCLTPDPEAERMNETSTWSDLDEKNASLLSCAIQGWQAAAAQVWASFCLSSFFSCVVTWHLHFRLFIAQGCASSQNNLGLMSEQGRGVPQDDREAVQWYSRAAEQGDAGAMYNLGWMIEQGRGVGQSNSAAAARYKEAAHRGFAPAQLCLGLLSARGHGVPQSTGEAAKWLRRASEGGLREATYHLGLLAGYADQDVPVAPLHPAAERGVGAAAAEATALPAAVEALPVPKHEAAHLDWYEAAAAFGDPAGAACLAELLALGSPRLLVPFSGAPEASSVAVGPTAEALSRAQALAQAAAALGSGRAVRVLRSLSRRGGGAHTT